MPLVAFDMDGVLVDSERFWLERERIEIFPSTVARAVDPEAVTGMNVEDLYDHLDTEFGTTVSKSAFVEQYDRAAASVYGSQVSLLDGFDRLVGLLQERDVPVALVSSSPERWIDRVLDRFDFREVFDAVVSAEHVDRGKPAPDVYRHTASLLDADPTGSLAIEDSAVGLQAATNAGYGTLGYLNGTNERATLSAADDIVDGPDELARAVADWRPV